MNSSRPNAGCALVLLLVSLNLNLWNNDFPLGFHVDERKKVYFIRDGEQDFHHPILMLQIPRAANALLRYQDPFDVVVLGRTATAFAGALLVLASYWLASQIAGPAYSFLIALGVALSPMTVMHAHYLKEDILFACWAMASLASYIWLLRRPTLERALVLGVTTGLAGSSQYKAGLLVPLYLLFPLCISYAGRKKLYLLGGLSAFIAVDVFLLVNLPLLEDVEQFMEGVRHDARQLAGPTIPIRPLDHWWTYYWTYAIVPGLTMPLAITGLAGLAWTFVRWTKTPWEWKLLACYFLLFYFVQEASSSKPPPNHERYMVPVAPALICFAGRVVETLMAAARGRVLRAGIALLSIGLFTYPGYVSVRLCHELADDTRLRADEWLGERGGRTIWERLAGTGWSVRSAGDLDVDGLQKSGTRYVVTSSFVYDVHLRQAELAGQPPRVYERARGYEELFHHPYVEIAPDFRSFGFGNPVIRIVDIGGVSQTRTR